MEKIGKTTTKGKRSRNLELIFVISGLFLNFDPCYFTFLTTLAEKNPKSKFFTKRCNLFADDERFWRRPKKSHNMIQCTLAHSCKLSHIVLQNAPRSRSQSSYS